ncbi:hypothetical protein JHK85_048820 [Glycine max]|nr:hypothetical protein JHK85_048820 [Glycine max]
MVIINDESAIDAYQSLMERVDRLEMGDKKKKAQMFVKLVSAAGTGFFYVKRKPRQFTEKLEFRKYDPRNSMSRQGAKVEESGGDGEAIDDDGVVQV